MTTTLRPTEPLRHGADGGLSRHYQVCVNSRPVGALHLATHPEFGPRTAVIRDLRIAEPDRGRGRGAVAALAAEEVARAWGCTRIETIASATADAALGLAAALGYQERGRRMDKTLDGTRPALPEGSTARPMTDDEYGPWLEYRKRAYADTWIRQGVPEAEARAKSEADHARELPRGLATEGVSVTILEHAGKPVGTLWAARRGESAFVLSVEVDDAHRGRGHGRSLMLAAEDQARSAGFGTIGLFVFAGNTPAIRLYESLGYRTENLGLYKQLV
ncbi:GNAT family N-acetyltransferase [Streptomyces sp. TS71-3]|uniref:GNAT family N-acetyltransferase n=1 Tax=Streptomyces sp. TS71-3 TaxID=2733862 RepID=UPI001B1B85EF|nr:GNAT family N-acetyltransferase [Streptomyces sp. TS71-3]GHJ38842.1 N-acetyltransferase [Streptomyces sp. TS71-3]